MPSYGNLEWICTNINGRCNAFRMNNRKSIFDNFAFSRVAGKLTGDVTRVFDY
jgi:hypothetical protein